MSALKNSEISIDTNVLLRLCLGDVPAQGKLANKLVDNHKRVHLSVVAVTEAVYVMKTGYGFDRQRIANTLLAVLSHPNIRSNIQLFRRAFGYYIDHTALSFEDCYLACQAREDSATPLYTFDKKLAKQLQHTELLT